MISIAGERVIIIKLARARFHSTDLRLGHSSCIFFYNDKRKMKMKKKVAKKPELIKMPFSCVDFLLLLLLLSFLQEEVLV